MNNSSAPVPEPSAPTAPFVSPDPQNPSRGLADWIAGLAGVDPAYPMQPAPSPLDDRLRDFYRGDPAWLLQLRR